MSYYLYWYIPLQQAKKQTLGAAKQYSSGFESSQFPADGLMGMGFKSISEYKADPVFQTLVADGQTSSPVFAFKLASSGAELSVGGTDSSLYTGSFTYAKVEQEGYWQVALDGISANGKNAISNADSIIDTGTTVIFFRSFRALTNNSDTCCSSSSLVIAHPSSNSMTRSQEQRRPLMSVKASTPSPAILPLLSAWLSTANPSTSTQRLLTLAPHHLVAPTALVESLLKTPARASGLLEVYLNFLR